PCVPRCNYRTSSRMGFHLSTRALCAAVLLFLLVGERGTDHRSFLELRQLSRTLPGECLPGDAVSFHVDCDAGHGFLSAAGLPARLLPLFPRRQTKGFVLSAGNYSSLGQLPGSGVRLENDSGQRWCVEYPITVSAPDQPSFGLSAV